MTQPAAAPSSAASPQSAARARDRRRQWRGLQIAEGFQLKYVITTWAHIAAVLFVGCAIVVSLPMIVLLRDGEGTSPAVAERFLMLHAWAWPGLLITLVLIAMILVATSHRVAGPMVRFRRVFAQVRAGTIPTRVRLRKGDLPTREAQELEGMLRELGAFHAELRAKLAALQGTARALREVSRVEAAALQAQADQVLEQIETLRRLASRYAFEGTGPALVPVTTTKSEPEPAPKRAAGFSLIEILLTCVLIGILAAIAIPNYQEALQVARVARAIGDIKAIEREISLFSFENGRLPNSLAEIGRDTLLDPWGSPYQYLVLEGLVKKKGSAGHDGPTTVGTAGPGGGSGSGGGSSSGGGSGGGGGGGGGSDGDKVSVGDARKDKNLVPINSDYDLYSVGRDHRTVGPIGAKVSLDDVIRANDGSYVGLASNY